METGIWLDWSVRTPMVIDLDTTLEYAIVSTDGAVARTFDTLGEARAALYAMSAPMNQHPRLMQRHRSPVPEAWAPIAGGLVLE
jgi:hypothetical protein